MDILVTEAEGPVLVRSDRSAQLGCFQYAVPGPDLVSFFSKAVRGDESVLLYSRFLGAATLCTAISQSHWYSDEGSTHYCS